MKEFPKNFEHGTNLSNYAVYGVYDVKFANKQNSKKHL